MIRFSRRGLGSIILGSVMSFIRPTNATEPVDRSAQQHAVLLGDSTLDNAAYVPGGPDVLRQVKSVLPTGWLTTLNAVDGSVTTDVAAQLRRLPASASHLIVSVGGNDALRQSDILTHSVRSVGEALSRVAAVRDAFERDYRVMLDQVLRRDLPTAVCTIYDPRFPDAARRKSSLVALAAFNDVITRAAFSNGIALIDLRLVCSEDADFANHIEPSVEGGRKIAEAVGSYVLSNAESRPARSEIFTR